MLDVTALDGNNLCFVISKFINTLPHINSRDGSDILLGGQPLGSHPLYRPAPYSLLQSTVRLRNAALESCTVRPRQYQDVEPHCCCSARPFILFLLLRPRASKMCPCSLRLCSLLLFHPYLAAPRPTCSRPKCGPTDAASFVALVRLLMALLEEYYFRFMPRSF